MVHDMVGRKARVLIAILRGKSGCRWVMLSSTEKDDCEREKKAREKKRKKPRRL